MTLQHLDSAIAFAVIMLGASLLVTVLTQTISAVLNMRGKDLHRALWDLMTTLRPGDSAQAEELAREILEHPLLSETRRSRAGKSIQKHRLLVAVAAGALAFLGVLALGQGDYSPKGLGAVGAMVGAMVAFVVEQSIRFTGLASALRIEEFREMLRLVSEQGPGSSKEVAAKLSKILSADESVEERLKQIQDLTRTGRESMTRLSVSLRGSGGDKALAHLVDVALAGVGTVEQREQGLQDLKKLLDPGLHAAADTLKALADAEQALEAKAAALVEQAKATFDSKLKELEVLFTAAMDRASQRFATNSRLWTIAFSIGLALLIRLDAIALFKELSSDAELRAKLVASSDAMMKQADQILSPKPAAEPPAASASATAPAPAPAGSTPSAEAEKPAECLKGARRTVPAIYTAALLCPKEVANLPKGEPGPFPTRQDAIEYIEHKSTKEPEQGVTTYRKNLNALLQGAPVNQLFDNAASINGQLGRAGINLLPDPFEPRWPTKRELPGVLAAAVMLSLGAPFWFNLLKTLTNLRPLVATREENERKTKAKT